MAKDYTSIRVDKDAKQAAAQAKRDGETWDEYVQRCAENPPEVRQLVPVKDLTDDELKEMVATIEERTGKLERLLEDLQR